MVLRLRIYHWHVSRQLLHRPPLLVRVVHCQTRALAHDSNDCPNSSAQAMQPLILAKPPDVVASLMSQPPAQPNCIQALIQGSHSGI